MEYKIVGDVMQALQIQLHSGEEVYAEAGTMLYMGPGINLQARMQGGLMKGLMRKFLAGESMFMSVFRCDAASGHLALANPIAAVGSRVSSWAATTAPAHPPTPESTATYWRPSGPR